MMGGQNCHTEIVFSDGVVWIARFRLLRPKSLPLQIQDYILQSEVATMKDLESHTKVPSPRVFDWACEPDPDNEVGVGFILMEKMPGKPLNWSVATPPQRERIVRQLADIMMELERHPFPQFGSLNLKECTEQCSRFQVGVLADHSTAKAGVEGSPMGPFSSSKETITVEEDWAAWKAAALIKYQDDPLLKALLHSVQ